MAGMNGTPLFQELAGYERKLRENEATIARLQEQLQQLTLDSRSIFDLETSLHTPAYFHVRLQEELARAARHRHFLSLVLIHVTLQNQSSTRQAARELRQLGAMLRAGLVRGSDVVARYGKRQLVVLLPETDPVSADILRGRIQAQLPSGGDGFALALLTYPHDAASPAEVMNLLQASSEDLFRGTQAQPPKGAADPVGAQSEFH